MAYLYVDYDIKNSDDLMVYLMDYIMYGVVYDLLGWSTTFTDINFFPTDLLCYTYNQYDDNDPSSSVPTKTASGNYEQNTGFYSWKLEAAYPTQAEITNCIASYSQAYCYQYTC